LDCHFSNPEIKKAIKILSDRYGEAAGRRFCNLYERLYEAKLAKAFAQALHEPDLLPDLNNVFEVIVFFQSIRLYLNSVEQLIIDRAGGSLQMDNTQLVTAVLPALNLYCRNITRGYCELLMNQCYTGYEAIYDGHRLKTNRDYRQLEPFFIEPEVLSLHDQQLFRTQALTALAYSGVFSIDELRYDMTQLEYAFDAYKKRNPQIFTQLNDLIRLLSVAVNDDYWIEIEPALLDKIQIACPGLKFVTTANAALSHLWYDISPFRAF
jgi:hypothetical protein